MRFFLLVFLLRFSFLVPAQLMCTRTLHDTAFQVNDLVALPELQYGLASCYLHAESMDSLKRIASFLQSHPTMKVKIRVYTDYVNPNASMTLTACRARACCDSLNRLGITKDRISFEGDGTRFPFVAPSNITLPSGRQVPKGTVVNEAYWEKYKDSKDDYWFLRALNRRTEMQILSL